MQFDPPVERLNTEVKLCVLTPSLVVPLPSPNHGYCEDCGWRRALHKGTYFVLTVGGMSTSHVFICVV
jgi:hypothetical protein